MGIDAGRRPVPADHLQEVVDVVAELLRRDGRVFDERQRLGITLHGHRQAECGLAKGPDRALAGLVERAMIAVAEPARGEIALERIEAGRQVFFRVGVELDAQQSRGIALDEGPLQPFKRGALPGVIEDEPVHHLDRRRLWARIAGVASSASSRSAN